MHEARELVDDVTEKSRTGKKKPSSMCVCVCVFPSHLHKVTQLKFIFRVLIFKISIFVPFKYS